MNKTFLHNFLLIFMALVSQFVSSNDNTDIVHPMPLLEFNAVAFPQVGTSGMVVSQQSYATEIGVEILNAGGNAVDAAVAVGFALAVTLPRAGNIGGGGFMMIYDQKSKTVNALDYREKAPLAATKDMFLDLFGRVDTKQARFSSRSSGVPGTVAGMVEAHKKFGKLSFETVIAPAISLAEGVPLTFAMAQSFNSRRNYFSKDPASKAKFLKSDGSHWQIGDIFRQPKLANTLKRISETYGQDFYFGKTADLIADYFAKNDGLITKEDLAKYQAKWRQPVSTSINRFNIYSMPPPSSGGVHLIQLLNILRNFPIDKVGPNSAYTTHIKTEAMKYVYADRSEYLGDPDFFDVPIKKLTSQSYAKKIANQIQFDKASQSADIKPGQHMNIESPQTTHFSVMDAEGNIVSNTYTLNFSFGSGKTIPEVGMLLNNEMDDFSAKPGSPNGYGLLGADANAIEAEKRPLSSMAPVIVLRDDKPWIATGSPGGSRIISIVFNFLVNRMIYDMNIAEATLQPRVHHQWYPDKLSVEKGFPFDSAEKLKAMGHKVEYRRPWGSTQSIEFSDGLFFGFSDLRRPGALAKGLNR